MAAFARVDMGGNPVSPMMICLIDVGGFIDLNLYNMMMLATLHTVLGGESNGKIMHPLKDDVAHLAGRIRFHRINIVRSNTCPLDTIYSNFIDALPVVKYCSMNNKHLIHLSTW